MRTRTKMTTPTWMKPSQWVQPKRGATGRGAPWTAGFLIRAATAPRRALWAIKSRRPTMAHQNKVESTTRFLGRSKRFAVGSRTAAGFS